MTVAIDLKLPLSEVRDLLLSAGHTQALWKSPHQWSGGFAAKQTTLNELEVAVCQVGSSEERGLVREMVKLALIGYQHTLEQAGLAVQLLDALDHPLLLVSRQRLTWPKEEGYAPCTGATNCW